LLDPEADEAGEEEGREVEAVGAIVGGERKVRGVLERVRREVEVGQSAKVGLERNAGVQGLGGWAEGTIVFATSGGVERDVEGDGFVGGGVDERGGDAVEMARDLGAVDQVRRGEQREDLE
jgi:hypothetical protein